MSKLSETGMRSMQGSPEEEETPSKAVLSKEGIASIQGEDVSSEAEKPLTNEDAHPQPEVAEPDVEHKAGLGEYKVA